MSGRPDRLRAAPLLSPLTMVLGLLVLVGGFFLLKRFVFGLGDVTNLSPGYPWGLWVTWDLIIGTALGCGGFAMAILIYVFNQGRYHPLMRPALLGSLFGYFLAGMAAVVDMGRWWQFYNLLLPWHWNFNSIMLETGLCVSAYAMLLMIEFSPSVLERFGLAKWRRRIEGVMWLIIALGILLPLMHQSSLGSILLVLGHKLSPLYNTPLLPLLFVGAALTMGYALVVVEATVISRSFRLPSEHALLSQLSKVVGGLLAGWLVVRWVDIVWRGALGDALEPSGLALSFWFENALALFAVYAFLSPRARADEVMTFLGGIALMLYGFAYRINAYLIAYTPAVDGYSYFPSVPEFLVTLGVMSLEILLFLFFIKLFPVLHLPSRQAARA
jgi:Ni/Fe-hydrogenase subunit HybB-like protein